MTFAWWILAVLVGMVGAFIVVAVLFTTYVVLYYVPHVARNFEAKPLFLAPQVSPIEDAENVEIQSAGGRKIAASYLAHRGPRRRGVILFCHEFLANRWLAEPYAGPLREQGFDVFTFDFCNHGESDAVAGYDPLHWATQHELADLRAAVEYVKGRPDAPKQIGLYGVSKGAATALAAAGDEAFVGAVVVDSAFPTLGTVTHYEMIWVGIYSSMPKLYSLLPRGFYTFIASITIRRMEKTRGVKYAHVERGVKKFAGRPLLLIHGSRDNYIKAIIIERLLAIAGPTANLWLIEKAKHNGCLEKAGDAYLQRVREFFIDSLDVDGPSSESLVFPINGRSHSTPAPPAADKSSNNKGSLA